LLKLIVITSNFQELAEYTMLEDIRGKKFRAIDIFAMAIKCLKLRLLANMKRRGYATVKESEIRWVITVPAIWSDAAKQYMRQAAQMVSCPCWQLIVCDFDLPHVTSTLP
jgi:molecular chaperone DnaK (HSP70)